VTLIKIFNFCWKIANKLIYIGVYVESRGFFHKFVARVIKMINFITISILDFGVTSHNVIDQSMIINFEMKKISGGEAKQNPRDST
jgi:hypothetical protein